MRYRFKSFQVKKEIIVQFHHTVALKMLEMVQWKGKDMEVRSACFSSSAACLRDTAVTQL